MLVPGVPIGVEKFEGSSDVKMVALEGDSVYLVDRVESNAGVKPETQTVSHVPDDIVVECGLPRTLLPLPRMIRFSQS